MKSGWYNVLGLQKLDSIYYYELLKRQLIRLGLLSCVAQDILQISLKPRDFEDIVYETSLKWNGISMRKKDEEEKVGYSMGIYT